MGLNVKINWLLTYLFPFLCISINLDVSKKKKGMVTFSILVTIPYPYVF